MFDDMLNCLLYPEEWEVCRMTAINANKETACYLALKFDNRTLSMLACRMPKLRINALAETAVITMNTDWKPFM